MEAYETVQECFQVMDWLALCDLYGEDISRVSEYITDYLNFCVDSCPSWDYSLLPKHQAMGNGGHQTHLGWQEEGFQSWQQGGGEVFWHLKLKIRRCFSTCRTSRVVFQGWIVDKCLHYPEQSSYKDFQGPLQADKQKRLRRRSGMLNFQSPSFTPEPPLVETRRERLKAYLYLYTKAMPQLRQRCEPYAGGVAWGAPLCRCNWVSRWCRPQEIWLVNLVFSVFKFPAAPSCRFQVRTIVSQVT